MHEFHYFDIFATKGFEYLLVIGFFLGLVAFWMFLNSPKKEIQKAELEREELRRLLQLQRERMEDELAKLRDQRDYMQNALLAQFQAIESRAAAAWRDSYPDQRETPDLMKLFDWVLTEREALVEDKRRLDYLSRALADQPDGYRMSRADGSVVVGVDGGGSGRGSTLREALDAVRPRETA